MKKKISPLISILFAFTLLTGCAQNNDSDTNVNPDPTAPQDTPAEQDTAILTIEDFYPFNENVIYTYEGQGNEYASYTLVTDYIKDNRVQIRTNNGGTEMVKVLENKDGELRLLLSQGETYYRENFTQTKNKPSEVILKEPLKKGTSWELTDNRKRTITDINVEINTPAGKYEAIEVTTEGPHGTIVDYYGKGVGLIKSVFNSEGTEVVSSLAKIEKETPYIQTVKFYYPNIVEDKIITVDKKLSFKTNELTKVAFEKEFKKSPSKNVKALIGPNVKINSLYLNKDGMVYVDFTNNLVSEMNAGSGPESMILQSIANTLGNYYGKNKVYITIEGKPYSSGHIEMKKGEAFEVK